MSFENLNFGPDYSNAEKEPISPSFLQEQIRLPEVQWDKRFRDLVEQKIREKQEEEAKETEESPETLEESYRRYLKVLALNEDALKGKRVLDLGFGRGEFVSYLIDNGITDEAYGIDDDIDEKPVKEKFKNHFFEGDFREDLPLKDVDFIVSVGAMPARVWSKKEVEEVKNIIKNSLNSLRKGGEIRLAGISEAAEKNPLKGLELTLKRWRRLLKEIAESYKVECEIKPIDIMVYGDKNYVTLECIVVIKKARD